MNTRLALGSLIQLTGTQLSIDDVYNKNRTKKANNKSTTRPQEYMESAWWCDNHLEKYEFVNGWWISPFMKWKLKSCLKPPRYSTLSVALLESSANSPLWGITMPKRSKSAETPLSDQPEANSPLIAIVCGHLRGRNGGSNHQWHQSWKDTKEPPGCLYEGRQLWNGGGSKHM